MPIWRRDPDEEPPINSVLILLDTLTAAERRDLANSLLRAAWSATLEETASCCRTSSSRSTMVSSEA